jgi:hypothetical protein
MIHDPKHRSYRLSDNDFGKAERGSRIRHIRRHTLTSDNAVQNHYLKVYSSCVSGRESSIFSIERHGRIDMNDLLFPPFFINCHILFPQRCIDRRFGDRKGRNEAFGFTAQTNAHQPGENLRLSGETQSGRAGGAAGIPAENR